MASHAVDSFTWGSARGAGRRWCIPRIAAVSLAVLLASCGGRTTGPGPAGHAGSTGDAGSPGAGGAAGSPPSGLSCESPWADCDLAESNGCEVDLSADPDSCAACRRSCLGDPCTDGECPYHDVIPWGGAIALDETRAYTGDTFMEGDAYVDELIAATKDGGPPETLMTGMGAVVDLTWHDGFLGFTTRKDGNGFVYLMSAVQSEVRLVADGQREARAVEMDDEYAYWSVLGDQPAIRRARITGGEVITLVAGERAWDIALDSTSLFWTEGESVRSLPKEGGEPSTLVTGLRDPRYLAVDADRVCWAEFAAAWVSGSIGCVAKSGGDPVVWAVMGENRHPWQIAIRAGMLYWTEQHGGSPDGTVMRLDLASGTVAPLASDQTAPSGLAVDDGYVYWGAWPGGIKRTVR